MIGGWVVRFSSGWSVSQQSVKSIKMTNIDISEYCPLSALLKVYGIGFNRQKRHYGYMGRLWRPGDRISAALHGSHILIIQHCFILNRHPGCHHTNRLFMLITVTGVSVFTLTMLKPEYFGISRSIPWLGLAPSPGHQPTVFVTMQYKRFFREDGFYNKQTCPKVNSAPVDLSYFCFYHR